MYLFFSNMLPKCLFYKTSSPVPGCPQLRPVLTSVVSASEASTIAGEMDTDAPMFYYRQDYCYNPGYTVRNLSIVTCRARMDTINITLTQTLILIPWFWLLGFGLF